MSIPVSSFLQHLPPPLQNLVWRAHPLDGKLLLFDRNSGLNVLLEGEETAHFKRIAPRTLLIAVTNACNLACSFCYRDLSLPSVWRYETLLDFCQQADQWGVLEVAFGGGEPTIFPEWGQFINELYDSTQLAVNFTTNGIRLTHEFLKQIAGKYGQIRVSLYEDNHWADTITRLAGESARFGVNWLVHPGELEVIETKFMRLLMLGVRDFLLLSYKGSDPTMHLNAQQREQFTAFVRRIYAQFGNMIQIKLDVCWGDSLGDIPRLFAEPDCGAGSDFLSITSDKHVKACSFQQSSTGIPFETIEELQAVWMRMSRQHQPAQIAGCARLPNRGIGKEFGSAYIDLATIR
jgi:MoaA/NifB/PqqE/SkfB family radical SAM enzyme